MKKTYEDYEQDRKDYLKEYISHQGIIPAILYYLCISHYRCEALGINSFDKTMDYKVTVRTFNPINPLSWILFIITFICCTVYYIWTNPLSHIFSLDTWRGSGDIWELFKFE